MLSSRVMQYGVEEKTIKKQKIVGVEYFKYGKRGHKYRECPLQKRKERVTHTAKPQKAH